MRAAKFARDSWPEQRPSEVMEIPDRPRSWEELDCPDEIELELAANTEKWTGFEFWIALDAAGMSCDVIEPGLEESTPEADPSPYTTKQAEDCWYAGVPRGRRLVLRRI